jgi:hypothetical protein
MRTFRDSVFSGRTTLAILAPVIFQLSKDQHRFDVDFSAAMTQAVTDYGTLLDTETEAEELISTIDAKADSLATLQTELAAKRNRNELALRIVGSVIGKKLYKNHLDRLAVYTHASTCAEALIEVDRGADALWSELHMLQAFEVADLSGSEAVQAVMWWRKQFARLTPVREQLHNIAELFESDLTEIMDRLETELSIGTRPETSEWVDTLLGVLVRAIEAAQQSIATLTNPVD